jgi:hypothetical protein
MDYRLFMKINRETSYTKKIILTLASCAVIAPLAFAQTRSTHKNKQPQNQ